MFSFSCDENEINMKHGNTSEEMIKCRYCNRQHARDRTKCPAFNRKCNKCGFKNHFASVCTNVKSIKAVNEEMEKKEDEVHEFYIN